jgi:hypothetical protein
LNKEVIKENNSTLENLKVSKVILPTIIGLAVVIWMMAKQLDISELSKLSNSGHTLFWIFMAVLMYVLRHLFYAWRLRIMSNYIFSWSKSIELVFIWEFSSCVSPTSVGGAGVALYLISQEKISGAKTISIVLYSMVVDTIFFVISLPLLFIILGPVMIRPGLEILQNMDGYGITFMTVLLFMTAYGGLFFYGLFINPKSIKKLLFSLSRLSFLGKFRASLRNVGTEIVVAAKDMKTQNWKFHAMAFNATFWAWITRFFAINCLVLALVAAANPSLYDHLIMLGRGEAMHTITSFSPTPGAAGVAEYLFGGFFSDYIPAGIAVLIALIWRLISY